MNLHTLALRSSVPSKIMSRTFSVHPQPCRQPLIVTLVGAGTSIGKVAALLLKQNKNIQELRLHCIHESICGVGVDVSHIDSTARLKAYVGPNLLRDAIQDSKVIVVVGHPQSAPGETEEEVFVKNAPHVRTAAIFASEFAPEAIFCVGCQPVNALIPMVSEEFKRSHNYDPRKIIGITNLATIRANAIIACYTNQDACRVFCPVIGGFCPYSSVCILSQAKPISNFPFKVAKNIQAKLARADDDILELKRAQKDEGGCVLSQAFAISRFVNHLTHSMQGCKNFTEFAFVKQDGDIGKFLPYMTSVVKLGPEGVASAHMPKVNKYECSLLQNAAIAINNSINLGSTYVTGVKAKRPKRQPKIPPYCVQIKVDSTTHDFEKIENFIPFEGELCPSDKQRHKQNN